MKHVLSAAFAIALLVPSVASAAEATGVVQSWNAGQRLLTLKLGLTEPHTYIGCTFEPSFNVPATIAAGRTVDITYTGQGAGMPQAPANNNNKCSQLSLK